jgi:hypothetical protein
MTPTQIRNTRIAPEAKEGKRQLTSDRLQAGAAALDSCSVPLHISAGEAQDAPFVISFFVTNP